MLIAKKNLKYLIERYIFEQEEDLADEITASIDTLEDEEDEEDEDEEAEDEEDEEDEEAEDEEAEDEEEEPEGKSYLEDNPISIGPIDIGLKEIDDQIEARYRAIFFANNNEVNIKIIDSLDDSIVEDPNEYNKEKFKDYMHAIFGIAINAEKDASRKNTWKNTFKKLAGMHDISNNEYEEYLDSKNFIEKMNRLITKYNIKKYT